MYNDGVIMDLDYTKEKILVVEDEKKINDLVKLYLEKEGYQVAQAFNGREALELFQERKPDLIVLDLLLPQIDGREVCKTIRKHSEVPIIMLTARTEEVDKLIGLEIGADDYITKPFSPRELVARVKVVLRRYQVKEKLSEKEEITVADLNINFTTYKVSLKGKEVELTPTEFRILEILIKNMDRVFSRGQLVEWTRGHYFEGYERIIDVHIKNLRGKIEEDPREPRYIKTVFGLGYKFEV